MRRPNMGLSLGVIVSVFKELSGYSCLLHGQFNRRRSGFGVDEVNCTFTCE